jgi:hypothetical protein
MTLPTPSPPDLGERTRKARGPARGATLMLSVALLSACANAPTGPSQPTTTTLNVSYLQPTDLPAASSDPSCPHHYAPSNLTLTTSWGESVRLQPAGDRVFTGVVTARPGAHWMRLIDIAWCGSDLGALAARGLSVNGIQLGQLQLLEDSTSAFRLTVSESGAVRP